MKEKNKKQRKSYFCLLQYSAILIYASFHIHYRFAAISPIHWGIYKYNYLEPEGQSGKEGEDEEERCALLFFGLVKNFQETVLPSISKNIFSNNRNCDVFIHTYDFDEVPQNVRNKETTAVALNASEAYALVDDRQQHKSHVLLEKIDIFNAKREDFLKHSRPLRYRWYGKCCISHDNIVKQWHSIAAVWDLMRKHELAKLFGLSYEEINTMDDDEISTKTEGRDLTYYTHVGMFRADVYYVTQIENIVHSNATATIPAFGKNSGYNDRLFYGTYENTKIWADRFAFSNLFETKYPLLLPFGYGEKYKRIPKKLKVEYHSEAYLGKLLDHHNMTISENDDICVWRIRAGNKLQISDCDLARFNSSIPEGFVIEPPIGNNWYWFAKKEVEGK